MRKSDEKINNEILDEEKLIMIKYIEQLEHKLEIQENKIISDKSHFEALETKIESLSKEKLLSSSDVRIVQTKEKDTNLIKSSDFENNFIKDEINDLRIVKLMENSTINNLRKQV